MKILKEGSAQPVPPPPWWIGEEVTCEKCGGHFKLEPGDNVTSLADSSEAGRHAEMICPTPGCNTIIWLKVKAFMCAPAHPQTIDK